jgi:hypothetical protein
MRNVIVNNAVLRMRHQLNIPAPRIDAAIRPLSEYP